MAKKKKDDRKVIFRRIGGRIVPIAVGGAVAADAARTKRIFVDKKKGITIDKKTNVRQSLSTKRGGTELIIKKGGKKAGFANIAQHQGDLFRFNFIKIGKKFRNQGLSKVLSEESAREMVRQGAKGTINQVIHKGSILSNFNKKRDRLLDFNSKRISKKAALEEVELFQELGKHKGKISFKGAGKRFAGGLKGVKKRKLAHVASAAREAFFPHSFTSKDSGVFRETSFKYVRKKGKFSVKPFRTKGNKFAIAGGLALAGAGALGLFDEKGKK